jgi:hypothetical protein
VTFLDSHRVSLNPKACWFSEKPAFLTEKATSQNQVAIADISIIERLQTGQIYLV